MFFTLSTIFRLISLLTLTLVVSVYAQQDVATCDARTAIPTYQAALPTLEPSARIDTLLKLAHAYQKLGLSQAALQTLQQAQDLATQIGDRAKQALVLNSLSDAHLLMQKLEKADQFACEGLKLANQTGEPLLTATLYNTLGNLSMMELVDNPEEAGDSNSCRQKVLEELSWMSTGTEIPWSNPSRLYQAALGKLPKNATDLSPQMLKLKIRVLANLAQLYYRAGETLEAVKFVDDARQLTQKLPQNCQTAWQLLNLGKSLQQSPGEDQKAVEVFQQVLQIAKPLKDDSLIGYAKGYLGEGQARSQHYVEAQKSFQEAIFHAQLARATPEILARWYWQLGRVYWKQGQLAEAQNNLEHAVNLLEPIRPALLSGNRVAQSFRESVGQIYLDLIALLLQKVGDWSGTEPPKDQETLSTLLKVLERFRRVELENYFKDDCVAAAQEKAKATLQEEMVSQEKVNDQEESTPLKKLLDTSSNSGIAILHTVTLAEKAVILLEVGGMLYPVTVASSLEELQRLRTMVIDWRQRLLSENGSFQAILADGHSLYQLILGRLEPLLQQHKIHTLVIVPDDIFRTIPFAALNVDGMSEKFLVTKYALVAVPGLSLLTSPKKFTSPTQLLFSGISKEATTCHFDPLLDTENFRKILRQFYPQTKELLDEQFTITNLEDALRQGDYQVIVVATHAKFQNRPGKTNIVSYDINQGCRISMEQLSELLHLRDDHLEEEEVAKQVQPLILLVLAACETAKGSDRAALGLAGAGIKAGANVVLGSLWKVEDNATNELLQVFFEVLQRSPHLSKAQALQQAQMELMKQHSQEPFFWAGFLMIGSGW